jgi:CheY-like chemotaxis protein
MVNDASARRGNHILVVEDDAEIRDAVLMVLEEDGLVASATRNGQEALEWIRANGAPALILLDLMMPVMDGWRLRTELKRDARLQAIPVVAVTASTEKSRIKAEFEGYLEKPVDLTTLLHTAESYCHH